MTDADGLDNARQGDESHNGSHVFMNTDSI